MHAPVSVEPEAVRVGTRQSLASTAGRDQVGPIRFTLWWAEVDVRPATRVFIVPTIAQGAHLQEHGLVRR